MNLLLEKRGYFTKIWFIWFLPACTAQSANASSMIWFTRPVELYIQLRKMNITPLAILGVKWPFSKGRGR